MRTFALLATDFFPLDIMDRDFPEKPSLKTIEPTNSNQEAAMIRPSSFLAPESLRDELPKNTSTTRAASPGMPAAGKPVDPNHFPTHLYKMLEEIDNSEGAAAETVEGKTFASIVSWQPHGKCFLIHDEDMFSKYVLPKYFCRLKFTSFQRQLHFHGFKRLCKQGPDKGAYYHDLFARGMPEVATYIQRIKSTKGLRGRKRKSQDQEPDFYKQSPPSMAAMIAKANNTEQGSPEQQSRQSVPTNQAPLPGHIGDSTDMVGRLEPTPIGQIQTLQGVTTHGGHHQDQRLNEGHSNKRQRRSEHQAPCRPSYEESKVNVWVVQPLVPQRGEENIRNIAQSDLMGERSNQFAPALSSNNVTTTQTNVANSGGDGDLWQLGMFALADRSNDALMSQGHTNMTSSLPDLEPTPLRVHQDQASRQEQFLLDQQQQFEEDQLQQQILRQIDEQQRQLLQQRQNILQRQQMRLQQRQVDLGQELQDPFSMQQQQVPLQQPLQQQQPLGLSDNLYPFEEEQEDRLSSLMGYSQHQRDQQNQGGFSKHC